MSDTSALNIEYSNYEKEDIPENVSRNALNGILDKASAMTTISLILRASEIERQAQEDGGECLNRSLVDGLHKALIQLGRALDVDAITLGATLCGKAMEVKNGCK
jgi:hypothetical protein